MAQMITFTLPAPEIWVGATFAGILALSALIFWATTPHRHLDQPDEPLAQRALKTFVIILALPWVLLICATFVSLWNALLHSPPPTTPEAARWSVAIIGGQLTALIALVPAPLALIRVYTTERQTRTAEQGHMTDRISNAVEHLGAEKTVKIPGKDENGKDITIEATRPNIEVRIGGLLSLERIAQDSVKYDKGRDHVRVMEILTAYIRENAPDTAAKNHDFPELEPLKDNPTDAERTAHNDYRKARFGRSYYESNAFQWAQSLPSSRADIAIALRIIGLRDEKQCLVEAAWPNAPSAKTIWPFAQACPALPDTPGDAPLTTDALIAYQTKLAAWNEAISAYPGYRPDLRKTNLQQADLSNLILSGANLQGARMEGADLEEARMEGANLGEARFSKTTSFSATEVSQVALKEVDLSMLTLTASQVKSAFGDASVTLPNGITPASPDWPAHWPKQSLGWDDFETEWEKWKASPKTYTPP